LMYRSLLNCRLDVTVGISPACDSNAVQLHDGRDIDVGARDVSARDIDAREIYAAAAAPAAAT